MPNRQDKKTLLELQDELVKAASNKMDAILTKTGKKKAWYYTVLKNPQKLSPIERQVFADEFGVSIEAIDWQDELNLIA